MPKKRTMSLREQIIGDKLGLARPCQAEQDDTQIQIATKPTRANVSPYEALRTLQGRSLRQGSRQHSGRLLRSKLEIADISRKFVPA
ncbi:hypothetical protein [Ruegeria hyattellae]|uniref:hypothetical protein n=1 Tax=Ruegeria hyattellae TaxID=3233337 RepID=UPI00355B5947